MDRITTQYSGTRVSLGFSPSSSFTQGILQINHHVNPLAWELWAVGRQEENVEMGLRGRRKPGWKMKGELTDGQPASQDGSSRERRGVILEWGGTGATCWKQWNLNRQRERVQRSKKRKEWVHCLRKRTEREKRKPWANYGWSWRSSVTRYDMAPSDKVLFPG